MTTTNVKDSALYNPNSYLGYSINAEPPKDYEYVPVLKQSGFLIGEPVGYTSSPSLPANYRQFTPRSKDVNLKNSIHMSPQMNVKSSQIINSPQGRFTGDIQNRSRLIVSNSRIPPQTSFSYLNSPQPMSFPQPVRSYSPGIVTTMEGMVPRAEYQKCASSCRIWQQKFNELYQKYVNETAGELNISKNINNDQLHELNQCKKQNLELKSRLQMMEANQDKIINNMESMICTLVEKYKESTLKECMLLTDRYRLQKKTVQRM